MSSLYQLTGEWLRLQEEAEAGGDIGEALMALEDSIEAKAENIAQLLASWEADMDAMKREEQRLEQRRDILRRHSERLEKYLRESMEAAKIKRIKSPLFTVTVCKGRPKVIIDDFEKLPAAYVREKVERTPNKVAILDAFEQLGECVEGAHVEETTTLRIR